MKLFEQTRPGDVEMLYIKENVFKFGVLDGAPLMDRRHPCLHSVDSPAVTKYFFWNLIIISFSIVTYSCSRLSLKFVSSDGLHL